MKLRFLPVICLAAFSLLSGCSKNDDDTSDNPTPTETTSFKAVIDGSNWEAANHNTAVSGGLFGLYGNDNAGRQLIISTDAITKTGNYTSGSLSYVLPHSDGSTSRWTGFLSDSTVNKLTITSYDPTTKKISGTFQFKGGRVFGATTEPDSVNVMNGTFTGIRLP
ncbi:DUF6252 family protein [Adhaeribacter terreus]|uniref:DUF6252 family protein n=1 Tax=Adhaeribacter terreus TaxID=529703 RepID=A0ABW0ECS0_9BACT